MTEVASEQLARLTRIGWRPDQVLPEPSPNAPMRPGRVIIQHRAGYVVHDGETEFTAQPAPRFLKRNLDPLERPAVGDFVLYTNAKPPLIEVLLPRRSMLTRAAAGERYQRQAIAANVDYVFVLTGLDGDFNLRRIERYLLLVQGSGAQPVLLLSKMDLCTEAESAQAFASVRALSSAPVMAMNTKDPANVALLLPYLQLGDSAVLVGSSGAGKSTLTNTLLGRERQATSAVREHDSRGRHTTTHRALLQLPSGGCLIDTPGMRELKLTGTEALGESSFADIEALAESCRFGDCTHLSEPGCSVRAALDSGALDAGRWENYRKLRLELGAAGESLETQIKRKSQARVANKALNQRLLDKYGRR